MQLGNASAHQTHPLSKQNAALALLTAAAWTRIADCGRGRVDLRHSQRANGPQLLFEAPVELGEACSRGSSKVGIVRQAPASN